jgi:hypothetical protein
MTGGNARERQGKGLKERRLPARRGGGRGHRHPPRMRPAPGAAPLDPYHTQVILVPGDTWGDESPWLSRVAAAIASGWPSVTLVVNGGEITYGDIEHSLEAGRPVIVLAGTGRTADAIAAAAHGRDGGPEGGTGSGLPGHQGRAPRRPRGAPLGDRGSPGSGGLGETAGNCACQVMIKVPLQANVPGNSAGRAETTFNVPWPPQFLTCEQAGLRLTVNCRIAGKINMTSPVITGTCTA